MPENKDRYNVDELVNSLLQDRKPAPLEPAFGRTAAEVEEKPVPMIHTSVPDIEEDDDDEPNQLLSFDELAAAAAAAIDEELALEDEEFVPYIIETDDDVTALVDAPVPTPPPVFKKADRTLPVASHEKTKSKSKIKQVSPAPQKRKRRFAREMEDTATIEQSWLDWGLKPIGQTSQSGAENHAPISSMPKVNEQPSVMQTGEFVKPGTQMDEFPAVTAVAETVTMPVVIPPEVMATQRVEAHTRVIPTPTKQEPEVVIPSAAEELPIANDVQLPDQLSLEEMVRVEDIEPTESHPSVVVDTEDAEERFYRARDEKIKEFTLSEKAEEPTAKDTAAPDIQDFTGYQDTKIVSRELRYRCRSTLLSVLFSGLVEFILLIITLLAVTVDQSPIPTTLYLVMELVGLCLLMGLNYTTISRGLTGAFSLCANNDTAPAIAAVVSLIQLVAHFFNPVAALPYWAPVAGLLLVVSAIAHHTQEMCVRRNFAFVSYPADKYAATIIKDEKAVQEIGRRAVSDGEATVAYFRRTKFLSDYLANAYDEDCGDDWSRWFTPAALGLSLLFSVLSFFSEHVSGVWDWLSVLTGMICLSMPVSLLAVQWPLSASCRRMLSRGGFLNGWQAVRRFGSPDALVVDIADLYPDESMVLHGIKTFSGAHIDEAIVMAASLAVRSGGPLSMIFRRIIENKEELLLDVDSLVYEQGMGLSGWVDGRRVFVGNSRLLENHGIDVPSSDYEARYAKGNRKLVYVAIAGQLSAMFVVSYQPDPEIQASLRDLCRARVTLLVRSCDPNISASDLCESFELDEYYVDVLPASAGRMVAQLTEGTTDSLPAVMASNGHVLGTARVLAVCRGIRVKAIMALVVQSIAAALGLILCLLWTMNGTLSLFQPLMVMLVSLFFTWFVPLFKRA